MSKYFGTDGVRGIAGELINGSLAYKIGRFIGYYKNGKKNKILIARDTRISGKLLADAIGVGVVSSGSDVYDIGVSTTPSVSYLVRKHHFDFGVMISASHNPYYDNGIKVFNSEGEKLEAEIENLIEDYIDGKCEEIPLMKNDKIGIYASTNGLIDEYIDFLVSKSSPLVARLRVLIDCSNGSASKIASKLLSNIGCQATIVNASPNGININDRCGSTHIANLAAEAIKGKYDICFAFDGDADRCLAMTNDGKIIDGDGLMFVNAMSMKKHKELNSNSAVITVMSNLGLKKAFKENNIDIHETTVGDKYVQAEMKNFNLSIGGEQSGHIIFLQDLNTGDGLLTMIKTMNTIVREDKTIEELISPLVIYPQFLKNVTVRNKEAVLAHTGFKNKIKEIEQELNGEGRILVRASGTEPLIRIMCEAKSLDKCKSICDVLASYVEEIQ